MALNKASTRELTCYSQGFVCLLGFYVLLTSEVVSEWVPTCDSANASQLYKATPLTVQAAGTINQYFTQSYYHDIEPTSSCLFLIMQSVRVGCDKY